MEVGLRVALMRDGRGIIGALYNERTLFPDNEAPRALETCYRERPRRVQTLFGEVPLKRRYLHHRPSGTGRCPLDEALGLEGGFTPALARLMCRAASQSPSYEEGASDLAAYAGVTLDPRDLGRMVASLAPGLKEALASLPPAPASAATPAPIAVMYLSPDGTGVPMRREVLAGRPGKQEDGTALTREAKLGCVFTQTTTDEEGQPLRDPNSTSYVGTFQGCREVGILLRQEALRRGLGRAAKVVYLGDGAAWVWENCRLTFPGAVEILDFFHASEHVGELAKALFDTDAEQATARRTQWCHDMKATSPADMLAEVRTLLNLNPEWPEAKRTAIQGEVDYLESHASRTHYGEYRAKGYFIGSGVIEAGCKTVVGRRLKQSGMFWSETGAEDILSLRCLCMGPHFDAAWKARRTLLAIKRSKARRWSPVENQRAA
jgi:hypothetical protein